mmetsp:Transcript_107144/g.245294  ORF Transcript_107144/g.245294 Transcript_107144/m.245294 type:complete len:203 (-) Transcript_107144:103-711(-)
MDLRYPSPGVDARNTVLSTKNLCSELSSLRIHSTMPEGVFQTTQSGETLSITLSKSLLPGLPITELPRSTIWYGPCTAPSTTVENWSPCTVTAQTLPCCRVIQEPCSSCRRLTVGFETLASRDTVIAISTCLSAIHANLFDITTMSANGNCLGLNSSVTLKVHDPLATLTGGSSSRVPITLSGDRIKALKSTVLSLLSTTDH